MSTVFTERRRVYRLTAVFAKHDRLTLRMHAILALSRYDSHFDWNWMMSVLDESYHPFRKSRRKTAHGKAAVEPTHGTTKAATVLISDHRIAGLHIASVLLNPYSTILLAFIAV